MTASCFLLALLAQQELTLGLGSHAGAGHDRGTNYQIHYAAGLRSGGRLSLLGEMDFRATPNRRNQEIRPNASRDEASLFLTPGLRLGMLPQSRLSPFVATGFGLAALEQSVLLQNGDPFPGSRLSWHGVWSYGGGVDVSLASWAGLRFDLRDFYVASRHNPIASMGFQLKIGRR